MHHLRFTLVLPPPRHRSTRPHHHHGPSRSHLAHRPLETFDSTHLLLLLSFSLSLPRLHLSVPYNFAASTNRVFQFVGWLVLDEIIQIKRVRNILRCNRRNVSRGGGTALFGLTESRKEPGRGVACKSFVVIKIHLSWLDIYESPSVSPLRRIGF